MSDTVLDGYADPTFPGAPRSATDLIGFDRGTGTGEPNETVAHNLRLMKGADDAYNARDCDFFLDKRHASGEAASWILSSRIDGLSLRLRAYPELATRERTGQR